MVQVIHPNSPASTLHACSGSLRVPFYLAKGPGKLRSPSFQELRKWRGIAQKAHESQSKPGIDMVPEPGRELRRRPQLFLAGTAPF